MRRLRRDLLEDVAMAIVLMIVILSITAGLGVVALLEVPIAAAVIGSFVLERRSRRAARAAAPPPGRRPGAVRTEGGRESHHIFR